MDQPYYCDEGEPGFPTPPRPHGPMGGGGRDDRRKSKRYRRWRPGPDDHAHTELLANLHRITNPSVIVQPFEFDIGRPDRFAWNAASGTCAVFVEAHRSACDSRGAHRLFFIVLVVVPCSCCFRGQSRLQCAGCIAVVIHGRDAAKWFGYS